MPFSISYDTLTPQNPNSLTVTLISPGVLQIMFAYAITASASPSRPPINRSIDVTSQASGAQLTQLLNILTALTNQAKTNEGV